MFLNALVSGRVVSASSLRAMLDFEPIRWPENPEITGVGLGLFRLELDGRTFWGHEGLMIGFQSIVLHCAETGTTVAVVGNVSRYDVVAVARAVEDALGGEADSATGAAVLRAEWGPPRARSPSSR